METLYHDPMSIGMGASMTTAGRSGAAPVPLANTVNNSSAPAPSKRPAATIKPRPSPLTATTTAESAAMPVPTQQQYQQQQQVSPLFGGGGHASGGISPIDHDGMMGVYGHHQYAQTSPVVDVYGGGAASYGSGAGLGGTGALGGMSDAAAMMGMMGSQQQGAAGVPRPEQLHSRLSMIMGELHEIMGLMQRGGNGGNNQSPSAMGASSTQQQQQQALALMHTLQQQQQRFSAAGGNSTAAGPFSVTSEVTPSHHRGISPTPLVGAAPAALPRVSVGQRATPEAEVIGGRGSAHHPPSRIAQARAYNTGAPYQPAAYSATSGVPPSNGASPVVIIVVVEFKANRLKKYQSSFFVSPGTYVMVEGDRGVDCGLAVHCTARRADGSVDRLEAVDDSLDVTRLKPASSNVIRVASKEEVALLHGELASVERGTLARCRELVEEMNLPMTVLECEYQFDRKKVSFYFESESPVDFRELARELHKIYNSRIWLENVNTKVKNVVPDGALSQADKMMFIEMGMKPPRSAAAAAAAAVTAPAASAPQPAQPAGPVYGQRRRLADIRAAVVVEEVHAPSSQQHVEVAAETREDVAPAPIAPPKQASRRPAPRSAAIVDDETFDDDVPAIVQARSANSRSSGASAPPHFAKPVPRSAAAASSGRTVTAEVESTSTKGGYHNGSGGGSRRGGHASRR